MKSACLDYHLLSPAVSLALATFQLPCKKERKFEPVNGVCSIVAQGQSALLPFETALAWAEQSTFANPSLHPVLCSIHDLCQRVVAQLCFGLAPKSADFDLFVPDSAYTQKDAGPTPYSLKQVEPLLLEHTVCLMQYLQSLQVRPFLCSSEDRPQLRRLCEHTHALLESLKYRIYSIRFSAARVHQLLHERDGPPLASRARLGH
jgi:hypothetical protein